MSIADNINQISSSIPDHVILVAVSKTKPVPDLQEAYAAGQRIFGENRVEELVEKSLVLPLDIEWHMIGHLQSKKVKAIAPFVSLIHGVDSTKLLAEINKQAAKHDRVIDCLLQFHIATEASKYGFEFSSLDAWLSLGEVSTLSNVRIRGVMGMATFTEDHDQVRQEFQNLKRIFDRLKGTHFSSELHFDQISMGMSGDYKIAIEEGSTMIRVGSSIFGSRNYSNL
jgi:pyridoxal phosphate enzyme (YggS family)